MANWGVCVSPKIPTSPAHSYPTRGQIHISRSFFFFQKESGTWVFRYMLSVIKYWLTRKQPYTESGFQSPVRWLLWDVSLPSSWSASFLSKVVFLASTPHLSDSLASCVMSRDSSASVTGNCSETSCKWNLQLPWSDSAFRHQRRVQYLCGNRGQKEINPCAFGVGALTPRP